MTTRKRIAVAGATGRVGHHAVDVLEEQGHDVVSISRATGVDLITGDGLAAALEGVDTIIDAATSPSPDQAEATSFFTTAANNLQADGERSGVRQIVVVSIIGIDRFTAGYPAAKLAHEHAMLAGTVPVGILRAAQFHEFVPQIVEWNRQGDVAYVPEMRTQIVAARTVAEALVALATRSASTASSMGTQIPEIAGPRVENMVDIARLFVASRDLPLRIEAVTNSDDPDRDLYASGALLPGPRATLAGPTFEQWLESASRVRSAAHTGQR